MINILYQPFVERYTSAPIVVISLLASSLLVKLLGVNFGDVVTELRQCCDVHIIITVILLFLFFKCLMHWFN